MSWLVADVLGFDRFAVAASRCGGEPLCRHCDRDTAADHEVQWRSLAAGAVPRTGHLLSANPAALPERLRVRPLADTGTGAARVCSCRRPMTRVPPRTCCSQPARPGGRWT